MTTHFHSDMFIEILEYCIDDMETFSECRMVSLDSKHACDQLIGRAFKRHKICMNNLHDFKSMIEYRDKFMEWKQRVAENARRFIKLAQVYYENTNIYEFSPYYQDWKDRNDETKDLYLKWEADKDIYIALTQAKLRDFSRIWSS